MKQKFYPIPLHDDYSISVYGVIIENETNVVIQPYLSNNVYKIYIDNEEFEIASLVLLTFVGFLPADIIYRNGYDCYDSSSLDYDIDISEISNTTIHINGIEFTLMPKYPSYYISRDGLVYSEYYHKFIKKSYNHRNYPTVGLVDQSGFRSPRKVHRLVYETFIGPLERSLVIDHKNGKKWCSSDWNLEQIPQRENIKRSYELGLNPTGRWDDFQIHVICECLEKNKSITEMLTILNIDQGCYRDLSMLIHNILNKKYYVTISDKYSINNYTSMINKKDRKLDIDDVIEIKRQLYHHTSTIKYLSTKYGCSTSTISKIRDNKTWKSIRYGFNE